jgi:ABC-type spermidine/putrescine transport system permease subunit I
MSPSAPTADVPLSAADAPVSYVDASRAFERREARRYLLLLLPAVLVLLALFVYPLLGIVDRSFYKPRVGYTLDYYAQLWRVPVYLTVIWRTFQTSALVTLLCLALGYPLAYLLATLRPRVAQLLMIVVILPFFTSIIVRTYAWMVLLGRNGVVNQYLTWLGLTDTPLPLLYNKGGVLIGMTYVLLPYMILTAYSVMRGIDPAFVRAAHSLGASRWQAFWTRCGCAAKSAASSAMPPGTAISP